MKPTLVIMAAGLGSRYGGLKQLAAIDEENHVIMDYSVYDAMTVGFGSVICIIKPELEQDFRERLGDAMTAAGVPLTYAYQTFDALPPGYQVPEGRRKPFGTAHAVMCAAEYIHTPFAVINADDFYGRDAFCLLHDFLTCERGPGEYCMIGYALKNCLTEHGSVSRGICQVDDRGYLQSITERTKIFGPKEAPRYTEDGGEHFHPLNPDSVTSLNTWGFQLPFLQAIADGFDAFWQEKMTVSPLKGEYFLPSVVNDQLAAGKATARVLNTDAAWYGVTYPEDMPVIQEAVKELRLAGRYPRRLW